jgi:4-carboxymuconolactone decarboxylase
MHHARPRAPRLQPIPEVAEKARERMKNSPVNAVNVVATMAHNRTLSKAFSSFAQGVLFDGGLPRRIVELAVLRMGWNCQAVYEFGQHTLFGRDVGLSEAEIFWVTRPLDQHSWSPEERAALQVVDDLYADDCVGDAAWHEASTHFDEAGMVHLLMAAGCYRVVSGFLNSAGVQLDEGVPGWPHPPRED